MFGIVSKFARRLWSIHFVAKRLSHIAIVNCQTGYVQRPKPTYGRLSWFGCVGLPPNPYPSFPLSPSCLLSPTIFQQSHSTHDFNWTSSHTGQCPKHYRTWIVSNQPCSIFFEADTLSGGKQFCLKVRASTDCLIRLRTDLCYKRSRLNYQSCDV